MRRKSTKSDSSSSQWSRGFDVPYLCCSGDDDDDRERSSTLTTRVLSAVAVAAAREEPSVSFRRPPPQLRSVPSPSTDPIIAKAAAEKRAAGTNCRRRVPAARRRPPPKSRSLGDGGAATIDRGPRLVVFVGADASFPIDDDHRHLAFEREGVSVFSSLVMQPKELPPSSLGGLNFGSAEVEGAAGKYGEQWR